MSELKSKEAVREAKDGLTVKLKGVEGITSFGIGKARPSGEYVVRVTVRNGATAKKVPPRFHGIPVEVSVAGDFATR